MKNQRYLYLVSQGIINGCGGKGGFNFSLVMRHHIKLFDEFKQSKYESLIYSVERKVCGPHDVRVHNGGLLISYTWANLKFAYDIYEILDWTCLGNRVFIFFACFFGLMIGCIKYFHWCMPWNKRNISI